MDELDAIKDKVRFIFNGYKSTDPAMEVYEIEGELILGLPHEIGYKIMEVSPDNLIADAQHSHEWFEKLMGAIAYADLRGHDVPAAARALDAQHKLDSKSKPMNLGGRPKDMKFATCLRVAMLECMRAGIQPTKNETSGSNIICAADIVWDVLFELELADDFVDSSAIMRAWSREIKRFPLDRT
jgi:hypothetical protein